MAAHSRPLKVSCDASGCTKTATQAVFNTYNAPQGHYCAKHAAGVVRMLQREERPR